MMAPDMRLHPCTAWSSPADTLPWSLPVQISQVPMQQSVDMTGWPIGEQTYAQFPFTGLAQTDLAVFPSFSVGLEGVDAPAQFEMDVSVPPETEFPESKASARPASKSTVRRRSGQESAHHDTLSVGTDDLDQDGVDQATSGDEALRAREIADKMLEQLKLGGHQRQSALHSFAELVFKSKVSSRAAQMILEEASPSDAEALSSGLRGKVRNAVQSKHANYVVQKIVQVMPAARASFLIEELVDAASDVAKHRSGCRILCRILEHAPRGSLSDSTTADLLSKILDDAADLSCHHYGSYVIRHIIEYGLPEHHQRIVDALSADVMRCAKDKFGSHVVEAVIHFSSDDDKLKIVNNLLSNRDQLLSLASNQFGRHVVKEMLRMQGDLRQRVVETFGPMEQQLQLSRYGKSVVKLLRAASY